MFLAALQKSVCQLGVPWLGPALATLRRGRQLEEPLFHFTADEFHRVWQSSSALLQVSTHPYQMRHTGASSDALSKKRTQLAIKSRGGWMSDASQKRYTKMSQIQSSWQRLSASQREFCSLCETHLESIVLGNRALPALHLPKGKLVNMLR